MKAIRFLPLAFLAGVDGFNLFAPYAAVVLAAVPLLRHLRRRQMVSAPAVTAVDPLNLELVPAPAQ